MILSFDIIKIKIGSGGQMAKSLKISKSKLATWWWILETGFVNKKCLSWRVDNVEKKVWPPWCPRTILRVIQSLAGKFGYFGGISYLSNVAELRHSKYVFELLLQYQLTGGISFNSTPYPMFKGFNSFLWNYLLISTVTTLFSQNFVFELWMLFPSWEKFGKIQLSTLSFYDW